MKQYTLLFYSVILISVVLNGCGNAERNELRSDVQNESIKKDADNNIVMESAVDSTGEGQPELLEFDITTDRSYCVKDTVPIIASNQILYELTINEIAYTELRDSYAEEPENVILMTYTYENLSDQPLFIDDMSFQMMLSDEKTVLELYYPDDIQVPEPIEPGGVCTAQIAYTVPEIADSVVVIYHDIVNADIQPVKFVENNLSS